MRLRTLTALILVSGIGYGTHRLIGFLAPAPLPERSSASVDPWSKELRQDARNPDSLAYGFHKVVDQAAAERPSAGEAGAHSRRGGTEAVKAQSYLDRFSGNPAADSELVEDAIGRLPGRDNQAARALLLRTLAAEVVEAEHRPLVRALALKEIKASLTELQAAAEPEEGPADVHYHLRSMYELFLDHSSSEGGDLLLDAAEVIQNVQNPSARASFAVIYMTRFPDRAAEMKTHLRGIGVEAPDPNARPLAPEAVPEPQE